LPVRFRQLAQNAADDGVDLGIVQCGHDDRQPIGNVDPRVS
jgi:hypothetical protein